MANILNEKIVFNDWFQVEEASILSRGETISRMRLNRPEASAVLVFNSESQKFILTRQYRYALAAKVSDPVLEIVAGKMDADEAPQQTAVRECLEEIGYSINTSRLEHVASCFASPGYSSELLHLYYAEVTHQDKTGKGGGLQEEHEEIQIEEIDREEFIHLVKTMQIPDAKSLITGLWYVNRYT